jgi:hypothetical protein
MFLARVITLVLLCIVANSAFGELPTEIIDNAKGRFSEIYYNSESGLIAKKLRHRGLPASEQVAIATDITRAIAECIIDGLSAGRSPVAYTYLVLIADDSIDEGLSGRLRDAYPKAEIEEFNNLTVRLMRECRESAYSAHHLSPD